MQPKFSVVMPVYNVEKYLRNSIQSILNQTISDYELILVDDGSPDNCPKICDEYAAQYPQVRVVHQKNVGLSSARNAGFAIAKGEFVYFPDSDDIIHPDTLDYFKRVIDAGDKIPISKVVNLSNTFGIDDETKKFVTRYIRLTHCDIFFADAVIFVEGPAEKILVPSFINKAGLDSYYISIIEVNGRHAHSFRQLIEKIGIATLIVTDIDATETKIGEDGKERHPSVITAKEKGYKTGNPTVKSWFPEKEQIDDLLALEEKEKIVDNVRIAFQTPVNVKWDKNKNDFTEICPYTFEDALIFTNLELFRQEGLRKMGAITTIANLLKKCGSANELQQKIFDKLEDKNGFKKADFAISLLYEDYFVDLVAPVYIQEGLNWMKLYLDSNGNDNGK